MNPDQLGDQLPTLHGDGVRLRWLTADDVPALHAIFSDADVVRFMSIAQQPSEAATLAFLDSVHRSFRTGTLYQWGVELEGVLVGTCTLASIDREHRRAELGFALGRAFWRRGLIVRALPAVIQFAFERLDLHRVEADADPRNVASVRVLERLGFQREGLVRERYFQFGEPQDAAIFGLLRSDEVSRGGVPRKVQPPEHYKHLVSASGGSSRATLIFAADDTATIDYRSAWMTSGTREFRMRFRIKRCSDRHGLLCLTDVERLDAPLKLTAAEINEAVCGFDDDEERMTYWGVAYEYLRLPGGESHIPNDPQLMDLGSTSWNERMDLILIARVAEREYEKSGIDREIIKALCALDKLKLQRESR